MFEVGIFALVVWILKNAAEDTLSTVKGQSNPRMDRRKARAKSRASNPIWQQFVGWLGDVAEDARTESRRAREEKRQRQAEERRKRDLEEHPRVDAEFTIIDPEEFPDPRPTDTDTSGPERMQEEIDKEREQDQEEERRRRHEEDCDGCDLPGDHTRPPSQEGCPLNAGECTWPTCPTHGKAKNNTDKPTDNSPTPSNTNPKENTMGTNTGEIKGLDQCIAYCEALIASLTEHSPAGASAEQYSGMLAEAKAGPVTVQSAFEMQQAVSTAIGAIETHKTVLEDANRPVQEAYDASGGEAADKDFQTAGR